MTDIRCPECNHTVYPVHDDEVARENWRDAVKVLDEIEALHRPLPYSFIDEDGASHPTTVCSSCRWGVTPQKWPCPTLNAMAGYTRQRAELSA